MGKKEDKTNVMRILDQKKIEYNHYSYDNMTTCAKDVAAGLGVDPQFLYKTLVTVGKSKEHYVFMVPGEEELDLKKAAIAVGEKSIEMIHQKELLPLTGYIHGGCSPIGMKKQFKTTIHINAEGADKIFCSAGKIGRQVELSPKYIVDFRIILLLSYFFINNGFNLKKEKFVVIISCEQISVVLEIVFQFSACNFGIVINLFYFLRFSF